MIVTADIDQIADERVVAHAASERQVVTNRCDIDGHAVGGRRERGAVADLEAEAGVAAAVGVRRRREDEFAGADVGDADALAGGDGDAVELEAAGGRQAGDGDGCSVSPLSTSLKPKSATARMRAVSSLVVSVRWLAVGASLTALTLTVMV
jgi:hypothetical protein